MTLLAEAAQKAGVEYESGYVTQIDDSGEGVIIKTEDGRRFEGDMLIVASGAWTPSLLPEFDRPEGLVPTGQVLATIQLTPEEAKKYKGMPVILDIHTEYVS